MRIHHDIIWATLVQIGSNMWFDEGNTKCNCSSTYMSPAKPYLRFDRPTWDKYVERMHNDGHNAIIIDLADAMIFDSHPELAIEGSFTKEEMRAELDRLNDLGFEVIPKLNFSATHDVWMKDYSRMLSTPLYYKVCKELIDEVCELFEPRYFHIGFDEEDYELQKNYDYIVIRNNELWWHDLKYLAGCVEAHGARACIWADYARHRPDEFVEKLPKSIIPVNWYYFNSYGQGIEEKFFIRIMPFNVLEAHGFDQIVAGSTIYYDDCMDKLADYAKKNISKEHTLGFIQTTWESVEPRYLDLFYKGSKELASAREIYEK